MNETAKVLDLVDVDRVVNSLMQMIAIPSVNPFDDEVRKGFREQEVAEYYADRLSELGLKVNSTEVAKGRPNVSGLLKGKGKGPSIMLSGHLDTVGTENYPNAFSPEIKDNRVYGRGACDMKAALACYLEVTRVLAELDVQLQGDVLITAIADEEHLMLGSSYLGQNGPFADFGIIGEPSELAICPSHKGQVGYHIKAHGTAVHSSKPEEGNNSIIAISKFIEALQGHADQLMQQQPHPLCGHGRCTPTVIKGGTILSTVPDYCEIEVDRRTLPGESSNDVLIEYHQIIEQLKKSYPDFNYEVTGPTLNVKPLDIPLDSPIIKTLEEALEYVLSTKAPIEAFVAGTDAPNFGFPTVICGPGSINQAHSLDEYVEISDLEQITKIYLYSVLKMISANV